MSDEIGEDTPVKESASSDRELIEHDEMEDIDLHTVESISDLHYASLRSEDTKTFEVLQRESLRNLAQWLESQEEAIRQMRAVSLQLWRHLNGSEVEVQT